MPVALIGAGIAAAGAVGSSLISASANSRAANLAAQTAANNNTLSQQQYNSTKDLIQPYVDRGNTAADVLQGFLGLGGDPAKTQAAFDTYLNSTGYRFARNQGLDAATQSKAASGLLNSGAALKSLDAYGTGLAQQYGQDYVNNLGSVATRGSNAINALAGAGQANVAAQTANNDLASKQTIASTVDNGAITSGLATNLAGSATRALGASSFGTGNAMTSGYPVAFNQPGYAPFGG